VTDEQPFDGITVLEFGQFVAVPYAAQLLADGGAFVVKVEPHEGEAARHTGYRWADVTRHFLSRNRGTHSLPLALRHERAPAVLESLLEKTDVVLTNLRPGLASQFGLDYESLAERYPKIIVGNVTAFGDEGPDAGLPGMDQVVQAHSGLMAMNGGMRDGRPIAEGSPISDFMCAALLAYGVASALFRRKRTGRGGRVDTSLLMSALILQSNLMVRVQDGDAEKHSDYLDWLAEARGAGIPYAEQAGRMPSSRPARVVSLYYRTFTTKDSAIAIACPSIGLRKRLLGVLDLQDPGLDPNLSEDERHSHDQALQLQFEALFASESTEHWEALLRENGIPVSRVRFPIELIDNEQAAANDLFVHADHPEAGPFTVLGSALKLDEKGFVPAPFPLPFLSETREILAWAGFSQEAIEDAINSGVVAASPL
tara:strand:- start:1094 stop:2371 length:1278 start_codon:yes stop_codon:yes gene_type:complete